MKDPDDLRKMLAEFMASDAGKLLVLKLGEQDKYLRLAVGESGAGYTPVYFINGKGLRMSVESSGLAAAFTGEKQEVSEPRECSVGDVVEAIDRADDFCCPESFMYWLEKCTADKDGIPNPNLALTARPHYENHPQAGGEAM
jgi:hypothetical protein